MNSVILQIAHSVLESTNSFFKWKSGKNIDNIKTSVWYKTDGPFPCMTNGITKVIGDGNELLDSTFALATVSRSTKHVYESSTY